MRILGINASPNRQKSQTQRLLAAALEGARATGAEVESVNLWDYEITFCIGCRVCFGTGRCIYQDDYVNLLDKMKAADGMVWGSPNYSYCVTARMKALIDRMADVIHCQYFAGKYCVAVATGGRDDVVITDYLQTILLDFGAYVTGCAGAVVTRVPDEVEAAIAESLGLGRKLAEDIRTARVYSDQQRLIAENRKLFQDKIRENAKVWKYEFDYWEGLGWPG